MVFPPSPTLKILSTEQTCLHYNSLQLEHQPSSDFILFFQNKKQREKNKTHLCVEIKVLDKNRWQEAEPMLSVFAAEGRIGNAEYFHLHLLPLCWDSSRLNTKIFFFCAPYVRRHRGFPQLLLRQDWVDCWQTTQLSQDKRGGSCQTDIAKVRGQSLNHSPWRQVSNKFVIHSANRLWCCRMLYSG